MRRGHVPERTCKGCGRKAPRAELLRLVVVTGQLIEDSQGYLPGKGLYCCDHQCRERLAKKKNKLNKNRHIALSNMPDSGPSFQVHQVQRKGAFDE